MMGKMVGIAGLKAGAGGGGRWAGMGWSGVPNAGEDERTASSGRLSVSIVSSYYYVWFCTKV